LQGHREWPQDIKIVFDTAERLSLRIITDTLNTLSKANSETNLTLVRHIIGAIAFLEEPFYPRNLDGLLNLEGGEVTHMLSKLHSLVVVPISDDDPIQPLHPSFLEYLMDSELCTNSDFVIHPGAQQIYLALVCFKRMERGMKEDVLDLSSTTNHNINDGIQDIPMDLRYACLHWVSHLSQSPPGEPILVAAVDEFFSRHVLYWLKTLSFLSSLKNAKPCLQLVRMWLSVSTFSVGYNTVSMLTLLFAASRPFPNTPLVA
jgi:hypothetical protein